MQRRTFLVLLIGLGAAWPQTLPAGASKSERVDPLLRVGPMVKSVVAGSRTLEPDGDFFRAVLAGSEYDPCLRVERVNVRVPKAPRVKETRRYCAVMAGKERLSLAPDEQQDAEIANLSWREFELSFDLSYTSNARGAVHQELRCTLDPRRAGDSIDCAAR
jgi:hypothetical protein